VLNDNESAKFEVQDCFKSTILLRKFDEAAKKTDIKMKSIHDYKKLLTSKLI
jgi:predicted HD phosphohydrolase